MQQVVTSGWWHGLEPIIYGYEACEPGHSFGPAVRPYYLLHYVLEGNGQFLKDDRIIDVEKGDIFVIRPGIVTTYRTGTADPWKYSWIGFYCEEELPFLGEAVIRKPPVKQIFTYIRDHCREENLDGKIFSLTHDLLWQLSQITAGSSVRSGSYADYARTYLDNTYMQPVSIQALSDSLHIDRRYLTQQFRHSYGIPPQEYLMKLRLEKAKEFIEQGYTVTEAAGLSGFSDLSNFSRHFKRFFGYNPSRCGKTNFG